MSIKFNDTQLVLLSAASQRDDHCLVPPAGPKRAQVQRAAAKLLEAGLVKEIKAKAGAPIWRRDDETGQTDALKLTAPARRRSRLTRLGPPKERRNGARTIRSSLSIRCPNPVQTQQQPLTSQIAASPGPQRLRAAEPRSRRSSNCCSAAMADPRRACRRHRLAAAHDAGRAHRSAQARLRRQDRSGRQGARIGLSDRVDGDQRR